MAALYFGDDADQSLRFGKLHDGHRLCRQFRRDFFCTRPDDRIALPAFASERSEGDRRAVSRYRISVCRQIGLSHPDSAARLLFTGSAAV